MSYGTASPVRQRQVLSGRPDLHVPPSRSRARRRLRRAELPSAAGSTARSFPAIALSCRRRKDRPSATVTRAMPALAERKRPAEDSRLRRRPRRATNEDIVTRLKQQQREQEAQRSACMKIRERGLAMKLARVEQLFDGSRLIFYYTAEGRVDFRELVRDLAAHFRTRIEMRQIGVRDEARMLGGYGSCGRPLCCTTWLQSFEPISIKMAKQQNLSLNPSKLSGMCGRLKCCLRYELPNGKGVKHGGCADEGGCGTCSNPTGPGGGGCGSCGTGGGCGSLPSMTARPRIGITVGDPAGIGPEIAQKARGRSAQSWTSASRCSTGRRRRLRRSRAGRSRRPRGTGCLRCDPVRPSTTRGRDASTAIATAPINKEAFAAAGIPWRGHTELLAHLTGAPAVRDDVLCRRAARRARDRPHPAGGRAARADAGAARGRRLR